jgi:hypothetical protein
MVWVKGRSAAAARARRRFSFESVQLVVMARVAKRVDARDLKSLSRKGVPVRVWARAFDDTTTRGRSERLRDVLASVAVEP